MAAAPDAPPPAASPGRIPPLTTEQRLIVVGVMSALAVSALDATVVGTAMPTVIGQLGGLDQYGWVFSGYLLTATTTVPLYGRLADMVGRKPVFLFGLFVFLAGSVLCGLAGSMTQLIAFRTVQGVGAGAIQPISFTIAGDAFSTEQRARIQGLFSSVWGVSAVVGPAIGGAITASIGWRWVFFLNVPVGLASALIVARVLHERFERRRHRLDWAGAATLTGGIALLLFTMTDGGDVVGWLSPAFVGLLAASGALLVAFAVVERRAPEPLVDGSLLRSPLIATGLAISLMAGVVMYGLTAYVPPMVQGVHGGTPLDAGAAVAAMSFGWPIGSIFGGRLFLRFGVRPVVIAGSAMVALGAAVLTQLAGHPELAFAVAGSGITGLGMGLASTTLMVVIQGAVDWSRRGVATGLVQFCRTIGGAVGTGLMGALLSARAGAGASAMLDPTRRAAIPAGELAALAGRVGDALGLIFAILLVIAVAGLGLAVLRFPAVRVRDGAIVGEGAPG